MCEGVDQMTKGNERKKRRRTRRQKDKHKKNTKQTLPQKMFTLNLQQRQELSEEDLRKIPRDVQVRKSLLVTLTRISRCGV